MSGIGFCGAGLRGITGGELRDEVGGSTDTCRWFTRSELPAERLVDIAELAARLVL